MRQQLLSVLWRIAPFALLAVALALRLYGYNFDDGQMLQPDELAVDQTVYALGCCLGAAGQSAATWPSPLTDFFNSGLAPYNPHLFNYGSLPLYLLAIVTRGTALLGRSLPFLSEWKSADSFTDTNWIGRWLSALSDTASLVVIYRIGIEAFDRRVALLALSFGCFCVLEIQLSHFYAVDTMLTLFTLLTLWLAVRWARACHLGTALLMGASFGAALSTKSSAILLVLPVGLAALAPPLAGSWRWSYRTLPGHLRRSIPQVNQRLFGLLCSLVCAALVFVICEPYGIIDHVGLVSDVSTQSAIIVTHAEPVPYTLQFTGTLPYLFFLKNLVMWYLGPSLGVCACAGLVWLTFRALQLRLSRELAVLLVFIIPYVIETGRFWAKFGRYLLPITPLLYLFAAAFLLSILRRLRGNWQWLGRATIGFVLGSTALWAVAYMHIYATTNSQVSASRWIYTHVSPNTPFATEGEWDRSLPFCLPQPEQCPSGYTSFQMNLFDSDDSSKLHRLVYTLTHDKYIIMSTQRFVDSIPRVPNEYPLTTRYYRLLFNNRLNFRLVKRFVVHPQLGFWVIDDFPADENFTVFDHPDVRIFRRVRKIGAARANYLLTHPVSTRLPVPEADSLPPRRSRLLEQGNQHAYEANSRSTHLVGPPSNAGSSETQVSRPPITTGSGGQDSRLMLNKAQWREDQQAPTFDQMFPPHGLGMSYPVIAWLLLVEILGLALAPLLAHAFRGNADRGWIIAKSLSLIVLGWLVWAAVSLGWLTYDFVTIWLMILLLIATGAISWWICRKRIMTLWRCDGREVLVAEAVFLAGFAFLVLLRAWYPDLGHQFSPVSPTNIGAGRMGEKQLELAFINAIARSRAFPPLDPFFAGGYINYYYFGYVVVATLCKATTIAPATGFNLAIATFFALLVGTAYSIGRALTGSIRFGLCASLFVGCIGNLNGLVQMFDGVSSNSTRDFSFPVIGGVIDFASGLFSGRGLPSFDFWESTRLVPPVGIDFAEFPYFSYLFADLHAHVMAMPIDLAIMSVSLLLCTSLSRMTRSQVFLGALIAAFLLGDIEATNPIDFPFCIVLLFLGLLIGGRNVSIRDILTARFNAQTIPTTRCLTPSPWKLFGRLVVLSGFSIVVGLLALVFFPPLTQGYHPVFDTGIATAASQVTAVRDSILAAQPQLSGPSLANAVHAAIVTPVDVYWEIFGLFLFIALSWLLLIACKARIANDEKSHATIPPWLWSGFAGVVAAGCICLLLLDLRLDAFLTAILAGCLRLLALRWRKASGRSLWVIGLVIVAMSLSLFSETFFVRDYLEGGLAFRMNTVAKTYLEIWLLLSIGSVGALAFLWRLSKAWTRGRTHVPSSARVWRAMWKPWLSVASIGVCGCLIYTFAGTVARETYRETWLPERSVPLTLNGMAFMRIGYPGDYAGISWLNSHVRGTPVVLEADQADYNWRSRVVQFTGLPTLFGGIYEPAQRYGDEVAPRQAALEEIYSSAPQNITTSTLHEFHLSGCRPGTSGAAACLCSHLLHLYHVSYVYVGLMERQLWPQGIRKFGHMRSLSKVFHHGGVTIFHVKGSET